MTVGATNGTTTSQLREYVSILGRRKWIIITAVVGVVASSILLSVLQTPVYQATARMLLQPSESLFNSGPRSLLDQSFVQTEVQVLRSKPVQDAVRQKIGAAPPVSASVIEATSIVAVSAESTNPQQAARVTNTYVDAYIEFRRKQTVDALLAAASELQAKIDALQPRIDELSQELGSILPCGPGAGPECSRRDALQRDRDTLVMQQVPFKNKLDQLQVDISLKNGGTQVITPAAVPTEPVRPTPVRNAVIALGVGLLFGVSLAILFEHLDDSIKSKEDLERVVPGLPVVGTIPVVAAWKNRSETRLVSQTEMNSPTAEAYRALRTSIQFMGVDQDLKTILVTSPHASDGKTTTVANLAVALSRANLRTIVVSCDLRRPRIHEFFGLPNSIGFTSVLLGEVPLASALQSVPNEDKLSLLASGRLPPNPSELLSGKKTAEVFRDLRDLADVVLVDCPPVIPVTDAVVLSARVDATLLVAMTGKTTTRQVATSVGLLRQVGAPVAGMVLNGLGVTSPYGYSYGYTYSYAPKADDAVPRNGARKGTKAPERT